MFHPTCYLYCPLRTRGGVFLFNGQSRCEKKIRKSRSQNITHTTGYFNNSPVTRSSSQKRLGIHLYEKLNFIHHIKEKISKASNGIGVIKN